MALVAGGELLIMKKLLRRITIFTIIPVLLAFLYPVLPSVSAQSISQPVCDTDFYSSNNVIFFNPCDNLCSEDGGTIVALPPETVKYLDDLDIRKKAEDNMERYKAAEQATGVPWAAVAAIHYREASMNPASSLFAGDPLGSGLNVDGKMIVEDPNEDAINAMKTFVRLAGSVYNIVIAPSGSDLSTEQWGEAFLAYNRGFLYQRSGNTYDQSPYVMNGFDADHMNMSWVGGDADPAVSGVDGNKAGALAVFAYLAVNVDAVECESSGSAVAGDVIKTALAFALDYPVENGQNDVSLTTEAYRNAFPNFNSAAFAYPAITDCGRFVSTVMRASGVDPDFAEVYVPTLMNYLDGSPKYEALGAIGFDQMLPGDIIATPGHIILFTGPTGDSGQYFAADASFYDRVPSVRLSGGVTWMIGEGASVWRLK